MGGVEETTPSCRRDATGDPRLGTAGGECLRCDGSSGGLLLLVTSGV